MKSIRVKSLRGSYKIAIDSGLLEKTGELIARLRRQGLRAPLGPASVSKALALGNKILVVSQEKIARLHLKKLRASLRKNGFEVKAHLLPDGERAKSEKELFRLYRSLLHHGFERRDAILALGGGVVGDLSGFAAATYLRGIAFINVPTTLLAQVDSAIGGKTGINLKEGKNLAGAFYPPRLVISDIEVLKTLPAREMQASLAEVVKYGVIRDAKLFELLEKSSRKILNKDSGVLEKIVGVSSRIKAGVVSRDEFETSGETGNRSVSRMILNFGHTFGHGFEKALGYRKLLHGEAVSIGMICAAKLAMALKMFPRADYNRLEKILLAFHLPVSLSGLGARASGILSAMMHDKKKRAGRLRFLLPVRIGKVVMREDISLRLIKKIILEIGAKK